jgi:hypothetical protein
MFPVEALSVKWKRKSWRFNFGGFLEKPLVFVHNTTNPPRYDVSFLRRVRGRSHES